MHKITHGLKATVAYSFQAWARPKVILCYADIRDTMWYRRTQCLSWFSLSFLCDACKNNRRLLHVWAPSSRHGFRRLHKFSNKHPCNRYQLWTDLQFSNSRAWSISMATRPDASSSPCAAILDGDELLSKPQKTLVAWHVPENNMIFFASWHSMFNTNTLYPIYFNVL